MIADKNILKLQSRREIYKLINKNPGLHVREISRRTNIPKTTVQYHLNRLRKLKLIEEKSEENHLYYYVSNNIGTKEKQIIKLLRKKVPANIYLCLCYYLTCSQNEISKDLEIPVQTISRYLKKMLELGIIVEVPFEDGYIRPFPDISGLVNVAVKKKRRAREIFYRRNGSEMELFYRMILTHKDSIFSNKKIINAYVEFFEKLEEMHMMSIEGREIKYSSKKKLDDKDDDKTTIKVIPTMDSFINVLEDTFLKPPFCA